MTADHGESLGEHGELTHGMFAYEATLRVPLIVARVDPRRAGGAGAASSSTRPSATSTSRRPCSRRSAPERDPALLGRVAARA